MNKTKTGGVIAGVIMVLVVILFVLNIKVIPAGYVGVQYNINKGVEEKVLGQGWHLVSPTVKVKTYTVGLEQSYLTKKKKGDSRKDESFSASSSEGKALQIDLTYSYQFKSNKVSEVFTRFKGQDGEDVRDQFIKPNIVSWTKEVISRYKVSDILGSERANVNTTLTEYLADKFEEYGITISNVSLIDITYITALDLCLQGIISPSTIGIDVKKLDNADAQREKEKTTLYTRGKIIDALQTTIPKLINTVFKSLDTLNQVTVEETESSIEFSDYANPSFESQIETVGKAKSSAIMSNEAVVDELYGDTKTEEWKQEEINRLNARDGVETMEEPALNMNGLEVEQGTNKEAGSTSTLNGAQITSLMGIIKMVKEGSVTRSEAISIVTATLGISKEAAESFIEGGMTGESKSKSKDVRNVPEGVSETS